ncbi:hemolysin-coregulated protein (uncharacterized) [Serratia sp. FGI94]|uniref:Hcp family type VI secretion system effector n=1 Tax=Serratia sp. FGI94 TaxID=671990 RepID=UPI0002A70FCE|nr:type VI secretion system tube protein Hcp [Serratia sp. FGI94]AGB84016.1 hemolysin-coregulated protein (uncharacterized) [Serratia sp. FGI94]
MAVDMFLKVDGVSGESKDAGHSGCTDVQSFNWGANQPGNMHVGGGGGAGKVTFKDLNVHAFIDKATPAIIGYCASGKHVSSVTLTVCKAGGQQIEYAKVELKDVLVTGVDVSGAGSADGIPVNYSFQAAQVKIHYWEQTEKGGKGAEIQSGWNIKTNKLM